MPRRTTRYTPSSSKEKEAWNSISGENQSNCHIVFLDELRQSNEKQYKKVIQSFPEKPLPYRHLEKFKINFSTSDQNSFGYFLKYIEKGLETDSGIEGSATFGEILRDVLHKYILAISINRSVGPGQCSIDRKNVALIELNPDALAESASWKQKASKMRSIARYEIINAFRNDEFLKIYYNPCDQGKFEEEAKVTDAFCMTGKEKTTKDFIRRYLTPNSQMISCGIAAQAHEDAEADTDIVEIEVDCEISSKSSIDTSSLYKRYTVSGEINMPKEVESFKESSLAIVGIYGHTASYSIDYARYIRKKYGNIPDMEQKIEELHNTYVGVARTPEDAVSREIQAIRKIYNAFINTSIFINKKNDKEIEEQATALFSVAIRKEASRRFARDIDKMQNLVDGNIEKLDINQRDGTVDSDVNSILEARFLMEKFSLEKSKKRRTIYERAFKKAIADFSPKFLLKKELIKPDIEAHDSLYKNASEYFDI